MRKSMYLVMSTVAAATIIGVALLKAPHSIAQQAPAAAPAEAAPADEEKRAADMDPQPFNPQLAAMMGMIIAPRHAKQDRRQPHHRAGPGSR